MEKRVLLVGAIVIIVACIIFMSFALVKTIEPARATNPKNSPDIDEQSGKVSINIVDAPSDEVVDDSAVGDDVNGS